MGGFYITNNATYILLEMECKIVFCIFYLMIKIIGIVDTWHIKVFMKWFRIWFLINVHTSYHSYMYFHEMIQINFWNSWLVIHIIHQLISMLSFTVSFNYNWFHYIIFFTRSCFLPFLSTQTWNQCLNTPIIILM